MHQAGLARTGGALQGDDLRRAAVNGRLEGVFELVKWLVATDEARHLPGHQRRGKGQLVRPFAGCQKDGLARRAGDNRG